MKLKLNIDDREIEADRSAYVTAKTKQLIEFGYAKLTKEQVDEQVTKILEGKKLSIIGMFMEKEVLGVAK